MQLTAREAFLQFGHVLQSELFPHLEEALGPLSPELQLLTSVVSLVPLARLLNARRAATGRPAKDRTALATAFIAKAILNLPDTRHLIGRLRVDQALRQFCGWNSVRALPHESKFSRAFGEFSAGNLPQQLHAAVIEATQSGRLVGHIARDSTAIVGREHIPEAVMEKKRKDKLQKAKQQKAKKGKRGKRKGAHAKSKASERGPRIDRQPHQSLEAMLAEIPRHCDLGRKVDSDGNNKSWRGYKLHWDIADGQIPISALLTSASVHDSQMAIPLMTMSTSRVAYLYELMDTAYDADGIHSHSKELEHVAIIAVHPRRKAKLPEELAQALAGRLSPQLSPAQADRYKERTMVERVNARLKDEFGGNQIRVRGAAKVMAHLMFGVLALTVDQWLRISTTG
jgi:hypothetical protein